MVVVLHLLWFSHAQHHLVAIHTGGSCWAHATLSSLADRIKVFRLLHNDDSHATPSLHASDINLSIQFVLNCGADVAGSCHGGSMHGVYELIKHHTGHIPYETCQPYLACSSDSEWGVCPHVDTTCTKFNTCRTCALKLVPSVHPFSEECSEIDQYPNATIAEYGAYELTDDDVSDATRAAHVHKIQSEIFARGPVATLVNGKDLHEYHGGVFSNRTASNITGHVVTIVGWGHTQPTETGAKSQLYWICRNSWGQYWGEMGYFRILAGYNVLGIERKIGWATPGYFSLENVFCREDGKNCNGQEPFFTAQHYVDPSHNVARVKRRLMDSKLVEI